MDTFITSAIISSLITGAVIGAIPAICGAIKYWQSLYALCFCG